MTDMDRIVHTETNGEDNVDARDKVDVNSPEVEEANNVSQGHDHVVQHQQTDGEVAE